MGISESHSEKTQLKNQPGRDSGSQIRLFIFNNNFLPSLQVSLDAMFDVQIKRIHEYKRQLLNILGIIHRYDCIKVSHLLFVNKLAS